MLAMFIPKPSRTWYTLVQASQGFSGTEGRFRGHCGERITGTAIPQYRMTRRVEEWDIGHVMYHKPQVRSVKVRTKARSRSLDSDGEGSESEVDTRASWEFTVVLCVDQGSEGQEAISNVCLCAWKWRSG